ncbi:Fe-S protein assembly co-chaperone HscB [Pseudoteredinibacter isoporae]|uniref:Fe-S protein assembly co-chaperone HscB n=1 Tax=Pseudoteredinibacter isoporae TaxID=570281 RepID=UPI0031088241
MDLSENFFALYQLDPGFDIDIAALKKTHRQLQMQCHPDKFAAGSAQEQRLAVQAMAYVNQAFDTLSVNVKRAEYLLELAGLDSNLENQTHQDPAFLMQQMEWREELAELRQLIRQDEAAADTKLQALMSNQKTLEKNIESEFVALYEQGDYKACVAPLAKMHFTSKFAKELRAVEDELLDLD